MKLRSGRETLSLQSHERGCRRGYDCSDGGSTGSGGGPGRIKEVDCGGSVEGFGSIVNPSEEVSVSSCGSSPEGELEASSVSSLLPSTVDLEVEANAHPLEFSLDETLSKVDPSGLIFEDGCSDLDVLVRDPFWVVVSELWIDLSDDGKSPLLAEPYGKPDWPSFTAAPVFHCGEHSPPFLLTPTLIFKDLLGEMFLDASDYHLRLSMVDPLGFFVMSVANEITSLQSLHVFLSMVVALWEAHYEYGRVMPRLSSVRNGFVASCGCKGDGSVASRGCKVLDGVDIFNSHLFHLWMTLWFSSFWVRSRRSARSDRFVRMAKASIGSLKSIPFIFSLYINKGFISLEFSSGRNRRFSSRFFPTGAHLNQA